MSAPIAPSLRPLPLAVVLAIGITLAPRVPASAPELWWGAAAALALLAGRRGIFALPAVLACGLALGAAGRAPLPAGVIADDRGEDRVEGVVRGPVITTTRGVGAAVDVATGAELWVWASGPLTPGDRIVVTGRVRTAEGVRGPGAPDRRAAALRYELTAQLVEPRGRAGGLAAWAWRKAADTQRAWGARLDAAGGPPGGRAALRGIVTGDRGHIEPTLDARWRVVGIYHVLSVSGLHLAVIAGLAFALLTRLVGASPWGGRVHPARWAAPPALALALAYTMITGAQLATVRALLVIALVLLAAMLDRPLRLLDALGVAALVLLAWRPLDIYDASFQLSFTAALTLALRPPARAGGGVRGHVVRGVTSSAWVILTTAPLTAYHFQEIAIGGLIGNLVLTPALELLALPLALAGLAVGALAHALGDPPIALAAWIVEGVDQLARMLALGIPVGRVAVASAATMTAGVALALLLASRARRTRLDAAAWLALCLTWVVAQAPAPAGALRVTFLDVGQGDAALVELPDGAVWLIDAGGLASARDLAAASAPGRVITRALAALGHDHIDLAVLSHPHPDHYLGLAGIAAPIAELWIAAEPATPPHAAAPSAAGDLPSLRAVLAVLAARGTRIGHPPLGLARRHGDGPDAVELVVWGPRYQPADGARVEGAADPVRSVNDNSLVLSLHHRGRVFVLPGDLEAEGEDLAVAAGVPRADVVKVPHHGSPTSSSPAFVAATRPALAVISCGRGNTFGFPSPAVVARWQAAGAAVARTDAEGAITVIVDHAGGLHVDRFVVLSRRGVR